MIKAVSSAPPSQNNDSNNKPADSTAGDVSVDAPMTPPLKTTQSLRSGFVPGGLPSTQPQNTETDPQEEINVTVAEITTPQTQTQTIKEASTPEPAQPVQASQPIQPAKPKTSADSLAEKINTPITNTNSFNPGPPAPPTNDNGDNFTINPTGGNSGGSGNNNDNKKKQRKITNRFSLKMILGAALLFILVLGSGAGLYLSQQSQDLRQDASTPGCDNGVSINGTACQNQGDSVQYRCKPGSYTPGGNIWESESCNGGSCQGSSCTSGDSCSSTCRGTCNNTPSCSLEGDCSNCVVDENGNYLSGKKRFVCRGESSSGCNDAMEGNYLPHLSSWNSANMPDLSNPDTWCTTIQLDAFGPGGTDARVVFVGDNGEKCVEGTGCNPSNLDWDCSKEPPTGTMTGICDPATQTVGNLSYKLTVSEVDPPPSGDNTSDRIEYWMCLNTNNAKHSPVIQEFFGGNANWIGVNNTVYCYKLKNVNTTANTTIYNLTFDRNTPIGENAAWRKTIDQMATFVKNKFPSDYKNATFPIKANMMINGVWTDQVSGPNIKINPYACAPEPEDRTYNVSTRLICPDGVTPSEIGKRMFWSIWPPNPLTWNHNPALSAEGITNNTITQTITVNDVSSSNLMNVYVGLTKSEYGEDWDAKAFKALEPLRGMDAGTFFNPPTQMFRFNTYNMPSSDMELLFEAPPELCEEELACNSECTPSSGETDECSEALGSEYSCISNRCRLADNPTSNTCEAVQPVACNDVCTSDAQCELTNPNYECRSVGNNISRCRNIDYPDQVTCEAPPPMCLAISIEPSNPEINDDVTFTCANVDGVSNYGFRVVQPDGTATTLEGTGNTSNPYTITESGTFRAECRLCPSGECQDWPSNTGSDE